MQFNAFIGTADGVVFFGIIVVHDVVQAIGGDSDTVIADAEDENIVFGMGGNDNVFIGGGSGAQTMQNGIFKKGLQDQLGGFVIIECLGHINDNVDLVAKAQTADVDIAFQNFQFFADGDDFAAVAEGEAVEICQAAQRLADGIGINIHSHGIDGGKGIVEKMGIGAFLQNLQLHHMAFLFQFKVFLGEILDHGKGVPEGIGELANLVGAGGVIVQFKVFGINLVDGICELDQTLGDEVGGGEEKNQRKNNNGDETDKGEKLQLIGIVAVEGVGGEIENLPRHVLQRGVIEHAGIKGFAEAQITCRAGVRLLLGENLKERGGQLPVAVAGIDDVAVGIHNIDGFCRFAIGGQGSIQPGHVLLEPGIGNSFAEGGQLDVANGQCAAKLVMRFLIRGAILLLGIFFIRGVFGCFPHHLGADGGSGFEIPLLFLNEGDTFNIVGIINIGALVIGKVENQFRAVFAGGEKVGDGVFNIADVVIIIGVIGGRGADLGGRKGAVGGENQLMKVFIQVDGFQYAPVGINFCFNGVGDMSQLECHGFFLSYIQGIGEDDEGENTQNKDNGKEHDAADKEILVFELEVAHHGVKFIRDSREKFWQFHILLLQNQSSPVLGSEEPEIRKRERYSLGEMPTSLRKMEEK